MSLRQAIENLASAIQQLSLLEAASGCQHDRAQSEWEVVVAPLEGVPASSSAGSLADGSIEASFPACPDHWIELCSSLGSSNLDPAIRACRAWRAGNWAAAVVSGRVATPRPSQVLSLRPSVYMVLRTPGLSAPPVSGFLRPLRVSQNLGDFPSCLPLFPLPRGGPHLLRGCRLSLPPPPRTGPPIQEGVSSL